MRRCPGAGVPHPVRPGAGWGWGVAGRTPISWINGLAITPSTPGPSLGARARAPCALGPLGATPAARPVRSRSVHRHGGMPVHAGKSRPPARPVRRPRSPATGLPVAGLPSWTPYAGDSAVARSSWSVLARTSWTPAWPLRTESSYYRYSLRSTTAPPDTGTGPTIRGSNGDSRRQAFDLRLRRQPRHSTGHMTIIMTPEPDPSFIEPLNHLAAASRPPAWLNAPRLPSP